jgi:hypothetical protein
LGRLVGACCASARDATVLYSRCADIGLACAWLRGAQTALRWAAAGARTFDDIRAADAADTLAPPLPPGRSLQRLAVQHAEQARIHAMLSDTRVALSDTRTRADAMRFHLASQLTVPVPREEWAPIRAGCEAAIRAADATAEVHIAGGYGRGRATPFDLDFLISPAREGNEVGLSSKLLASLSARPEVEWVGHQHHAAPAPGGALAALRTEAHRARKLDAAGQGGEPAGGVVSNIDMHDKLFLLLKLRDAPLRRVDFIVSARSQWAFCVLGWAGSRRFERFLRLWASDTRAPALRLNSHCAFNRAGGVTTTIAALSGKAVPLERAQEEYIDAGDWPRAEREVFERVLALPYRPPTDRDA